MVPGTPIGVPSWVANVALIGTSPAASASARTGTTALLPAAIWIGSGWLTIRSRGFVGSSSSRTVDRDAEVVDDGHLKGALVGEEVRGLRGDADPAGRGRCRLTDQPVEAVAFAGVRPPAHRR